MFLLGIGETGLSTLLQQYANKPLPDFTSVALAHQAPMPPMLPGQKAVLVTVTIGGVSGLYQKTVDGVSLLTAGPLQTA